MKKAVIFDLDGVLIDSEPHYRNRREHFFEEQGIKLTDEEQRLFIGSNPDDMFLHLFPDEKEKQLRLKQAYQEYGQQFKLNYREIIQPGLFETLKILQKRGLKLAVASSGSEVGIMTVLKELEIVNYFDTVVSARWFDKSKPHPEIYLYTLSQLNLSAEECLVIEDSAHGITAAMKAEIETLAIQDLRYGVDQSHATAKIEGLLEIPKHL